MIAYFLNPTTRDLICVDETTKEIVILERIDKVKVFTADGGVDIGDLDGRREVTTPPIGQKIRRCKLCGKPGHRRDSCPEKENEHDALSD